LAYHNGDLHLVFLCTPLSHILHILLPRLRVTSDVLMSSFWFIVPIINTDLPYYPYTSVYYHFTLRSLFFILTYSLYITQYISHLFFAMYWWIHIFMLSLR